MARRILVIPTNHGAGVTSTCLGLVHALERRQLSVGYLKPFAQARWVGQDASVDLFRLTTSQRPPAPIAVSHLEEMLAADRIGELMEEVIDMAHDCLGAHQIVVVEGLAPGTEQVYSGRVNAEMARTLDADVLLVANAARLDPERLGHQVGVAHSQYVLRSNVGAPAFAPTAGVGRPRDESTREDSRVIGIVVNHIPADRDPGEYPKALAARGVRTVASVPTHPEFTRRRVCDVVRELGLQVLSAGDQNRRVQDVTIAAQSVPGFLDALQDGRLIVVPGDRHEVLMAAALAETKGIRLGAVLLTASAPDQQILDLCRPALDAGLPVLLSSERTYETATRVMHLDPEIPADDEERATLVKETLADAFEDSWLLEMSQRKPIPRSTPAAFRHEVLAQASRADCRIAVADSTDPAMLASAINLQARSVCRCVLVGQRVAIERAAADAGLYLPPGLEIIEPDDGVEAFDAGLAMLAAGGVDGLVGGARSPIEEVGERAERVIGLRCDAQVVSTVHYLVLANEVVAYTDCTLNPLPSAEQLAAIALWAAEESQTVGITPRISFIEPSAASLTAEPDVHRVREAVQLVQSRRPDYDVRGPVAFSAASRREGTSQGVGNGTVFVFPDGATAKATFQAVHRASGVRAIGPILQGLNRPVNQPPSAGSLAEINAVIVATAVQASRNF
ncbi:MAG: phosphate acyltransferase [Micrococcales bacterium]|nr:phosphate acyltransferase [Micrococcales bacterium]